MSALEIGDRVALVDGDVVRLGLISEVRAGEPTIVRIAWDDGFDDRGPDGDWIWPHHHLKRVA